MNGTTHCFVDDGGAFHVQHRAETDRSFGTLEQLMTCAEQGHLSKIVLVTLLDTDHRRAYLDACGVIEKRYTENCAATKETCLASGCAVEGEVCLEPLLRAGIEYQRACAAEWLKLFADSRNRIEAWKN